MWRRLIGSVVTFRGMDLKTRLMHQCSAVGPDPVPHGLLKGSGPDPLLSDPAVTGSVEELWERAGKLIEANSCDPNFNDPNLRFGAR